MMTDLLVALGATMLVGFGALLLAFAVVTAAHIVKAWHRERRAAARFVQRHTAGGCRR